MPATQQAAPRIHEVPIGIDATGTRTETDSLGAVDVPADHYWGAQTQRSLEHFDIGDDRMPKAVYHAYGIVKKAALRLGVSEDLFDRVVVPENLTHPGAADINARPASRQGQGKPAL